MCLGLVLRRLKLPERLVAYWFDIVVRRGFTSPLGATRARHSAATHASRQGASHQLFHVCSIMGCAHLWRVYLALYEEGAVRYCHHTLGY